MRLRQLTSADKKIFRRFLIKEPPTLSARVFEYIYASQALYEIRWAVLKGKLCVFFRDRIGCFMHLPPAGGSQDPAVVDEAFRIMDRYNANRDLSRIENVEEADIGFFRQAGFRCYRKSCDYVYARDALAGLAGNRFKSKRSSCNYFTGHYPFSYVRYSEAYRKACLALYEEWKQARQERSTDPLYRGMLDDNGRCLAFLLKRFRKLDAQGRLILINGAVKAFTFGARLNHDTYCILYEVTDLGVKGIAQFIFRRFSQELETFTYINVMDDSGLENLKAVKISYRPLRLIPAYNVVRANG